ncbi:fluoride efflux transporter CrcB [Marinihelvus fidelis]|uniref:Fluoride-specific ion channel FluC n=1 Tax=Marinihelvus fidelis TaxID=2613842 RepID=A0A5N0TF96_9GAMM|nr:fluoride efflux transporter CrcB [Marinihelvus fidelis]KAA9131929.1 fluoride efflux transporter CrcB [Marinihelvus fidelis]
MNALGVQLLAVAFGGAVGAGLRFLVGMGVHHWMGKGFPWGTLAVNIIGSALIGYCLVILPEQQGASPLPRLLLITGVLGGFTTYSAFSVETLQLFHAGQLQRAMLNVLVTVACCLAAVWVGHALARWLHGAA